MMYYPAFSGVVCSGGPLSLLLGDGNGQLLCNGPFHALEEAKENSGHQLCM